MKMRKSNFPLVMKTVAAVTALATAVLAAVYHFFPQGWILPAAITAGTIFYHFAMRLLAGAIVPPFVKHPMERSWFQPRAFEAGLYKKLQVKHWKDHMPTYDPTSFSLRENSLEQVVFNSFVSEAVHETIMVFSFVPLLFAFLWGEFPVFLITSVLSATFDSCFVMMQR